MSENFVTVGKALIHLEHVTGARWDGSALFVYLAGGRFLPFNGDEAVQVWEILQGVSSGPRAAEHRRDSSSSVAEGDVT